MKKPKGGVFIDTSPKKPTDAEMRAELKGLFDFAREHVEPQMKSSAFVMLPMIEGYEDMSLALQVGLCLVLDKPLIIVALKGIWIAPRLRALAEEIVEGESAQDPHTREQIMAAIKRVHEKLQQEPV